MRTFVAALVLIIGVSSVDAADWRTSIERRSLSALASSLERVARDYEYAKLTGQIFFNSVRQLAVSAAKGDSISLDYTGVPDRAGAVDAWIASARHRSLFMTMTLAEFDEMSAHQRLLAVDRLYSLVARYRSVLAHDSLWNKKAGSSDRDDDIYEMPFVELP